MTLDLRKLDILAASSSGEAAKRLYDVLFSLEKRLTPEGGFAVELINDTGAPSIKGTLVDASTSVDRAFSVEAANGIDAIGAVYDDGIADGELCRIVTGGIAQVLLKNGTAATRGNWCEVSDVAGRVSAVLTDPNPVTHWGEVGHCLETVGAGTDVLAFILMHFN